MYSTLGQGIGYRKAEEAPKEGGNIAAQVVTKCGRVLGVTTLFVTYVNLQEAEKCNQNKWGLGGECWEAH